MSSTTWNPRKNLAVGLLLCAAVAIVAPLVLPFKASGELSNTLIDWLKQGGSARNAAIVILVPLALAAVVGLLSLSRSRRWQTGIAAFLLLIPTVLTGVTQYAAVGARVGLVASAIATLCAIALTVKPVRVD